ncbi:hypothetical protein SAMN05216420_10810 [Nitrosospira sp. Nl5]|nr:hypothetical protein SAMN05216420_10810 [Nitrosospira sp. Nl5]
MDSGDYTAELGLPARSRVNLPFIRTLWRRCSFVTRCLPFHENDYDLQ